MSWRWREAADDVGLAGRVGGKVNNRTERFRESFNASLPTQHIHVRQPTAGVSGEVEPDELNRQTKNQHTI